ncbi:MAG: hypothetical protein HFI36_01265 [Bacilli bacterium]|nr:hypothetical protein [Bacilli bacterium]MCX4254626.1 hypothetical protein [Bacilli bacterium]
MNNYLIPANSKKSQLILGFFTPLDLTLFGTGVGITLILLLVIQSAKIGVMLLILAPALITGFLVLPVPHYHNVLQFIINIYSFYNEPRRYIWKGWCFDVEE